MINIAVLIFLSHPVFQNLAMSKKGGEGRHGKEKKKDLLKVRRVFRIRFPVRLRQLARKQGLESVRGWTWGPNILPKIATCYVKIFYYVEMFLLFRSVTMITICAV
jgi:hypothetical protein